MVIHQKTFMVASTKITNHNIATLIVETRLYDNVKTSLCWYESVCFNSIAGTNLIVHLTL